VYKETVFFASKKLISRPLADKIFVPARQTGNFGKIGGKTVL